MSDALTLVQAAPSHWSTVPLFPTANARLELVPHTAFRSSLTPVDTDTQPLPFHW